MTDIDKKELIDTIKAIAEPIDFQKLISDGVLEKKGAWYKILDMERLPENAAAKIREARSDGCVKFSKPTKSLIKMAKKLSD